MEEIKYRKIAQRIISLIGIVVGLIFLRLGIKAINMGLNMQARGLIINGLIVGIAGLLIIGGCIVIPRKFPPIK